MNRNCFYQKKSFVQGFTLTELLVVIAIISILAALLLPVISRVKRRAHETVCLSNMKQLALGSITYINDTSRPISYDGASGLPGSGWMGGLRDYYSKNEATFMCPTAPLKLPAPTKGNRQGTANQAWVRWTSDGQTRFVGGYGYNAWLFSDVYKYYPRTSPAAWVYSAENRIQFADKTPVFVDANWANLPPKESDAPWSNLYTGAPFNNNGMGRCTISRHGDVNPASAPRKLTANQMMPGSVLMVMADGHTSMVKLEDLWNYQWHVDWQMPVKRPDPTP